MDRRGVLGLGTVQAVVLALLIIAVVVIAAFLAVVTMRDAFETSTGSSGSKTNESFATVADATTTPAGVAASVNGLRNCQMTVVRAINATGGQVIPSTNYTAYECRLYATNVINTFNSTTWNVTYTYTYDDGGANNIAGNLTTANQFFGYIPTIMILLAVVVLVLIIAIVIVAVSRFSGGGNRLENI